MKKKVCTICGPDCWLPAIKKQDTWRRRIKKLYQDIVREFRIVEAKA